MDIKNILKLEFREAMVLLIVFLLLSIVLAQPSLPHQLYGQVNCQNGLSVSDGLVIDIKDNGTLIKSTTSKSGLYGHDPLLLIWDLPNNQLIDVYVNNVYIYQINYIPGDISNLNLVVDNIYCPSSNPTSPPLGGSSGGGGFNSGISNIADSIQDSLNNIKGNDNSTNPGNNSSNNLNPPQNILSELSPAKMDRYVALNISLFTLIIMGLITFATFRKLRRKENQKVYK